MKPETSKILALATLTLALLLPLLFAANQDADASDRVGVTCVEGAELSPDGSTCTRVEDQVIIDPACPVGSMGELGDCFELIAEVATGESECDQGFKTDLGCVLSTEAASGGAPGCPAGYEPDRSLGGLCARFEMASVRPAECPAGSQGELGGCYILVARGPAGPPTCVEGTLVGNQCLVKGAPPVDGLCEDGFGLFDGDCVRTDDAIPAPQPPCPDDSIEDENGDCRKTVPDGDESYFCADPAAALNGKSCVFTIGARMGECPDGFAPSDVVEPCASSTPADATAVGCPDGTQGEIDNCFVIVAKSEPPLNCTNILDTTTPDPFDRVTGELVSDTCVITGEPPVSTPICPTSDTVFEIGDDCFTRVDRLADGSCPLGTTPDPDIAGQCRDVVDRSPGAPTCEDTFVANDGECVKSLPPELTCRPFATEQPDGTCRQNVANLFDYSCSDPDAQLVGQSCLLQADWVPLYCTNAGATLDGELCLVLVDPIPVLACPPDTSSAGDGKCRRELEDQPGGAFCDNPDAEPVDETCVTTTDAIKTCFGLAVTIDMTNGADGTGTSGPDVILGTDQADMIDGLGGDDVICSRAGDDVVQGGAGRDRIDAGRGADEVHGGASIDRIWGGSGDDTISGDGGSDRIRAGSGNDTVLAGSGADRVWGNAGNDELRGMGGRDTMWGGAGDDMLQGNFQSDLLRGGEGNDDIRGAQGKDRLYGEDGDDALFGGANTDFLDGGDGIDTADGQKGKDNPLVPDVSGCIAETKVSC